jgi:hypothetical protein
MLKILIAAALGVGVLATDAFAQSKQRYTYCLRDSDAGTVTCAYTSFKQCLAARTGSRDDCVGNPRSKR